MSGRQIQICRPLSSGEGQMPKYLSWWSLLAWMAPELVFAGLFLYAAWVEWCFR